MNLRASTVQISKTVYFDIRELCDPRTFFLIYLATMISGDPASDTVIRRKKNAGMPMQETGTCMHLLCYPSHFVGGQAPN